MSAQQVFDHVILGGGCAGLSLAVALTERGLAGERLLVVEPRPAYRRDRTWCYWDVHENPFHDAVARSWGRWRLRYAGRDITHSSQRYRYCEVPADAFYREAVERLERHPAVELRLGERALSAREEPGAVRVTTDRGDVLARRVFDGRPPQRRSAEDGLLQHFLGLHVQTESPAFAPGVVTLMDFDVSQADGIHFFYVLPVDERRALVEATFVSPRVLPEERYLEAIDRYLWTRCGVRGYKVDGSERGGIPMSPRRLPLRPSERMYRIGTAGGLVKPSTGYAFLAIQRWTQRFVERLARHDLPEPPEPRGGLTRRLDAIFLSYLRSHPERGPEMFARLFEHVKPDTLVRFLGDAASPLDRLAVMRALPAREFLQESWRSRRSWLQC